MTKSIKSLTLAGICACFAATLALAGCGNHDQAGASSGSGAMTPAQVQQNAQKQNQAPAGGQTTPSANAAPGNR